MKQKMGKINNLLGRKKFFLTLGKGLFGTSMLGLFPLSILFNSTDRHRSAHRVRPSVKVAIHPSAVKRSKKRG